MKKISREVCGAFMNRRKMRKSNTWTDGSSLYLFGNKIAWYDANNVLWITNCGFTTVTTKERLNSLDGVDIRQKNFVWYLNGKVWDGCPIRVIPNM